MQDIDEFGGKMLRIVHVKEGNLWDFIFVLNHMVVHSLSVSANIPKGYDESKHLCKDKSVIISDRAN